MNHYHQGNRLLTTPNSNYPPLRNFWQDDTLYREAYPVCAGYRLDDLTPIVVKRTHETNDCCHIFIWHQKKITLIVEVTKTDLLHILASVDYII